MVDVENSWPKIDGDRLFASEANGQAGWVQDIEAGENITAGNAIYIHDTDGKVYKSNSGGSPSTRCDGIAVTTALTGADVTVRLGGFYKTSGLTDKEDYYIGSSGAISTTKSRVRVGTALSTTDLLVKPKTQHAWVFVEEVSASSGNTLDFTTTLDGNNDDSYRIVGTVKTGAGSAGQNMNIRVNGATMNATLGFFTGGTYSSTTGGSIFSINASDTGQFELIIPMCKSGEGIRIFHWHAIALGTNLFRGSGNITTPTAATNITSLGINSVNTLAAGTRLRLYRGGFTE